LLTIEKEIKKSNKRKYDPVVDQFTCLGIPDYEPNLREKVTIRSMKACTNTPQRKKRKTTQSTASRRNNDEEQNNEFGSKNNFFFKNHQYIFTGSFQKQSCTINSLPFENMFPVYQEQNTNRFCIFIENQIKYVSFKK